MRSNSQSPGLVKKTTTRRFESSFLWAQPGSSCWVETPIKEKFFKATIISRNDETSKIIVKYDPHPIFASVQTLSKEVDFLQILRFNEQQALNPLIGFEDMVNMDVLNEAEVIQNLKLRYNGDMIFTYIGPTLLVINPYKPILSDFSPENYKLYSEQANSKLFILKENPPHVFAIGAKAFNQLINTSRDQAIVISGESGAGKTENTKFAMRFITSLSSEFNEESKTHGHPIKFFRIFKDFCKKMHPLKKKY
jgi:myosin heavy subunit